MQIDLNTSPYLAGNFSSYEEALQIANLTQIKGGYASSSILETVASSIQKVRRGEAAFERDGVAFKKEGYRYSLLSALFYIAMHEHKLNVLDFGGSLGSTYFQNRKLLEDIPMDWNVVEQENFVEYGRKYVPEVNFYSTIFECINKKSVNCLLMSSSINYVDDPYRYLNDILAVDAKYLIVDRTFFNFEDKDRISLEYVPENIYKAVYPITLLNINKFSDIVTQKYHMVFHVPTNDVIPFIEDNTAKVTPSHGWLLKHK